MSGGDGRLALVLHSHMPYVEGFGTWPFGEEWLWEAMATCYLPLLDVLDAHPQTVTVSLTPVLADQLAAPGIGERFLAFVEGVRERTHELDLAHTSDPAVVAALVRSRAAYRDAAARFRARGEDVLGGFAAHASWTSAATHAILPLLATTAGIALQLDTARASQRARFGAWGGGLWLPECAHAPWLDALLARAGVRHTCLDLTDTGLDPHTPLRSAAGPLLVPLDRQAIELVWSARGYPAAAAYRDSHRHTPHHHQAWANDGRPYEQERAHAQARADAADFVARVGARVGGGGLCVFAVDTELLGHWWHEGASWLAAVLERAPAAGLEIVALDGALEDLDAPPAPPLPITSWGTPRDLSTWSGPAVAELAFAQRAAELAVFAGGARPSATARRELLHLQASDWAFLISGARAGPYPPARARAHRARLAAALRGEGDAGATRYLAPLLG